MGFVTDMKRSQARETPRQPPYTRNTRCFFGVFVLIQCKTSQTCQDGAWIISGSNGRRGHLHTSEASDGQEGGDWRWGGGE